MRVAVESCKVNNAALCKHNCAGTQMEPVHIDIDLCRYWPVILQSYHINWLDSVWFIGVIIFTHVSVIPPGHTYAKTNRQRPQTGNPTPIWSAQPTPKGRDRRAIQSRRVLRCAGCGSGQVRDAASCRERRPPDHRSGLGVWLLASIVLSGPARLRGRWHCRPCATQAWTQGSTQAHQQDHRLSSTDPAGRSRAGFGRTGRAHQEALRGGRSSTNNRARVGASSKKTAEVRLSSASQDLVTHYEQLRRDALVLPSGGGTALGLTLFLRHGMTGWMHAWSTCLSSKDTTRVTPSTMG